MLIYSVKKHISSAALMFSVAVPIFMLDQITKLMAVKKIELHGHRVVIAGIFHLRHDRNSGAAFGILKGHTVLLTIVTVIAMGFIFYYYLQFRGSKWMQIGLGFLLGGAVGNFLDRIRLGEVIDFLQFGKLPEYAWPTFNVADMAVCCGATMLIIYMTRNPIDANESS